MRTTSHYLLWLLFLYVIEGMALHLNAELDAGCQRFLARVRSEGVVWLLIDPDMHGAWVQSNH